MVRPKILHIDENHPLLLDGLERLGYHNILAYKIPLDEILKNINQYDGVVIRSRFPIDEKFIDRAQNLQFIARVGAGTENINLNYARSKNIHVITAPEGNRNAVGEHAIGMLLSLMNKLYLGHQSIRGGKWLRETHRGFELENKTVGIIGYGNTGKSFAQKLKGFNVRVLCHDILPDIGDENAAQSTLKVLMKESQVLSLHIPQSTLTERMINQNFISKMEHPFWFLNTARGNAVVTKDLVEGLRSGKILGAGLDVLEYESTSFQSIFEAKSSPETLDYLLSAENVLISPHVGGLTFESHRKMAQTIVDKIKAL